MKKSDLAKNWDELFTPFPKLIWNTVYRKGYVEENIIIICTGQFGPYFLVTFLSNRASRYPGL